MTTAAPCLTGPSENPASIYPQQEGLGGDYHTFKLQRCHHEPVTDKDRQQAWDFAIKYLDQMKANQIGFQANLAGNYSNTKELTHLQDTLVNNIGDPFANGSYNLHTKFFERPLLDYFATLWNGKWPSNPKDGDSYWGFALSMGGTEGNLYGMWNGRDYLAGKVLLNASPSTTSRESGTRKKFTPKYVQAEFADPIPDAKGAKRSLRNEKPLCFFSKATHYSLKKAMVILNITTFSEEGIEAYREDCPIKPFEGETWESGWPPEVPENADGSINIDALVALVRFFAEKGKYSILICFNYGTVFKGSYDDIEAAGKQLIPIFQQYGLFERRLRYRLENGEYDTVLRNGWWFHVDGALGAAYMPFLEMARQRDPKAIPEDDLTRSYKFDFSLRIPVSAPGHPDGYPLTHSISLSGHKWIGAPVPCGIFMTKTKYQLKPPNKDPNYTGAADTTFAGSRSGLAVAFLWDHFSRNTFEQLMGTAIQTQNMARLLVLKLKDLEECMRRKDPNVDLYISRAKLSLGIVFKRPTPDIVMKYSLSKEEEFDPKSGTVRYLVHAYAMPHVTEELIEALIKACSAEGAFDYRWDEEARRRESVDLIGW